MSKVLFFNGNDQRVEDILCELTPIGFDIACYPSRLSDDKKIDLIKKAEYIILHPATISEKVLREAKSLRLIQLLTAGYDKIELKLTEKLGIPVATNGGANAWAVAEHSIDLLLTLTNGLLPVRKWRQAVNGFDTFEVAGKTVGIIGLGNIGSKVARRLKAFETDILYCGPFSAPDIEKELGARKVSLEELVQVSDIITLHAPLLPETRGLIGTREFTLMKSTAVLINTSRAELVVEEALFTALKDKQIAGAGLDVFYQEPISLDNPLMKLDNVVLSPHTAGHAAEGGTGEAVLPGRILKG